MVVAIKYYLNLIFVFSLISVCKIWALRAHPSSSCGGLGALRAPLGPAGPDGGLRPPVGLQYPNFELKTLKNWKFAQL